VASGSLDQGPEVRGAQPVAGAGVHARDGALALAIGATAAIFSVVDAVLIGGLPYPHADRLVAIRGSAPGTNLPDEFGVPDELYVQYREQATLLEDAGTYGLFQSTTRADQHVERLFGSRATPSLFTTLGARPALGRLPTPDDDDRVVVISHWLWTTWFGWRSCSSPGRHC
jgi:putative ABC transport system permease protein